MTPARTATLRQIGAFYIPDFRAAFDARITHTICDCLEKTTCGLVGNATRACARSTILRTGLTGFILFAGVIPAVGLTNRIETSLSFAASTIRATGRTGFPFRADPITATTHAYIRGKGCAVLIPGQRATLGVNGTNTAFRLFNAATRRIVCIATRSGTGTTEIRQRGTLFSPDHITTISIEIADTTHHIDVFATWRCVFNTA